MSAGGGNGNTHNLIWPITIIMGLIVVCGFMLYQIPKWQIRDSRFESIDKRFSAENAARDTLAKILGGGFFLITAYFSWRTLRATETSLKATQDKYDADIKAAADNLKLSESKYDSDKIIADANFNLSQSKYDSDKIIADANLVLTHDKLEHDKKVTDENLKLLRERVESDARVTNQNLKIAEENLLATQAKQLSERFVKATENLGYEGREYESVLLGATFSLERIARNSSEDHSAIVEVLAAYLRQHSRRKNPPTEPEDPDHLRPIPVVQAMLTVLARRSWRETEVARLNLNGTDLRWARLRDADFDWINLTDADLSGAQLQRAKLRSARLPRANFTGAEITDADLSPSSDAKPKDSELIPHKPTRLVDSCFIDADLRGSNFTEADLRRAVFTGADLEGTLFTGANLKGADLTGALHLQQDQLDDANTDGTTLVDKPLRIHHQ